MAFESGNTRLNVYRSSLPAPTRRPPYLGGDDVENIVRTLQAKGVMFEHYDLPETTRKGDIHVGGDIKVAWFKDPDGNILSVVNR